MLLLLVLLTRSILKEDKIYIKKREKKKKQKNKKKKPGSHKIGDNLHLHIHLPRHLLSPFSRLLSLEKPQQNNRQSVLVVQNTRKHPRTSKIGNGNGLKRKKWKPTRGDSCWCFVCFCLLLVSGCGVMEGVFFWLLFFFFGFLVSVFYLVLSFPCLFLWFAR